MGAAPRLSVALPPPQDSIISNRQSSPGKQAAPWEMTYTKARSSCPTMELPLHKPSESQ